MPNQSGAIFLNIVNPFIFTVSSYCHRADPSDANIVNLTVSVNGYKRTANTYMQALMYSSWQSDLTMAPEEEQVFVAKDPMGVGGACGKALTANMESITFTIDITAADAKDRCGITVVGFYACKH